jgi:type IV secretory pathway component VirB8
MSNDWMQQEASRQAAESGDPAAQTTSWQRPASYRKDNRTARRAVLIAAAVVAAVIVVVLAIVLL